MDAAPFYVHKPFPQVSQIARIKVDINAFDRLTDRLYYHIFPMAKHYIRIRLNDCRKI